jgi:hypothetical protein
MFERLPWGVYVSDNRSLAMRIKWRLDADRRRRPADHPSWEMLLGPSPLGRDENPVVEIQGHTAREWKFDDLILRLLASEPLAA